MKCSLGYLISLEAAASLILLLAAAQAVSLYNFEQESAQDFFLCTDAAIVISKSGDFSGERLQQRLDGLGRLSGLCMGAKAEGAFLSSCPKGAKGERHSLSLPYYYSGKASRMEVTCWRGE